MRRYPPRFEVLPHWGVYCRCQEFRTIRARPRALRLELGSFSLVGTPRENASRLAVRGIPQTTSVSSVPPRKACNTFMHRGPMDSIRFSTCAMICCPTEWSKYSQFCENHLNILSLNERYNYFKSIVLSIYKKKLAWNETYITQLSNFKEINLSKEQIKEMLLRQDLFNINEPFIKIKTDIWEQLS